MVQKKVVPTSLQENMRSTLVERCEQEQRDNEDRQEMIQQKFNHFITALGEIKANI